MGPSDGDIVLVSEKKYWKKRNKRTDRWAGALDQALGISETRYTMPKSFNGGIPPAYQQAHNRNPPKMSMPKKKKHKSVVLVIDTQNPNQIKVKGFKPKQKHAVKKKEKRQDMTIFGM